MGLYGYIQYDLFRSELGQVFNPPLEMKILSNDTNSGCINDCQNFPDGHQMQLQSQNVDGSSFFASISTPTGLVDYMGGDLCFTANCEADAITYFVYRNFPNLPGTLLSGTDTFLTGKLVLVSEAVIPEPSTLFLIGTGALGFLGTVRRRATKA